MENSPSKSVGLAKFLLNFMDLAVSIFIATVPVSHSQSFHKALLEFQFFACLISDVGMS